MIEHYGCISKNRIEREIERVRVLSVVVGFAKGTPMKEGGAI